MGILECDDGNLIDGDGCNSHCIIEPFYSCSGGNSLHPDTCKRCIPPTATFTALVTHSLVLKFNAPVRITKDCIIG